MSSEYVVEFHNVWKKYSKSQFFHNSLREEIVCLFSCGKAKAELHDGEFWALRDINLRIARGECIGLYGPNGSGKSTLLKLMANVTCPTKGNLRVGTKVAPLIELGAGFHPDLTGRENVFMNGTILGMGIREVKSRMDEIVEFSGLKDFIDVPVKKYSSGMYLRLAFSVAIHSRADTFLFDEILAVGDEEFQKKCMDKICEIKFAGKTIIMVSHNRESMERITDRIVYFDGGGIII